MASYRPSRELRIAQPCSESWEAMGGDSRSRHCVACGRDVLNTATMTPAQIEAVLAKPGRLPCMRMVRLSDGGLMTAQSVPQRSQMQRLSLAFVTSLVTAGAMAQMPSSTNHEKQATLHGVVVNASGKPLAHAKVVFEDSKGQLKEVETNDNGTFSFSTNKGDYKVDVVFKGLNELRPMKVSLPAGARELKNPIRLGEEVEVVVGEPSADDIYETLSTRKVKS